MKASLSSPTQTYCYTTFGAAAAHSLKFKGGGLLSKHQKLGCNRVDEAHKSNRVNDPSVPAVRRVNQNHNSDNQQRRSQLPGQSRGRKQGRGARKGKLKGKGAQHRKQGDGDDGRQSETDHNKGVEKMAKLLEEVQEREDVTFCQALCAFVATFIGQASLRMKERMWWSQLQHVGFLAHFESLLSTQGKETGMLEDHFCAVNDLNRVRVWLMPDLTSAGESVSVQMREPDGTWEKGESKGESDEEHDGDDLAVRTNPKASSTLWDIGLHLPSCVEAVMSGSVEGANGDTHTDRRSHGHRKKTNAPNLHVPLPKWSWAAIPQALRQGKRIEVTSLLITQVGEGIHSYTCAELYLDYSNSLYIPQGINEAQTMANAVGSAGLQDTLNNVGLGAIERYSRRLKRFHNKQAQELNEKTSFNLEIDEDFGVKMVCTDKRASEGELHEEESLQDEQDALHQSFLQDEEIDSILHRIRSVINDPREKKNYMLLLQTENICRALKGGRVTSCKSAKDRTSMAITLEQTNVLLQQHNMRPGDKEKVQ
jgi:hypothetical protein